MNIVRPGVRAGYDKWSAIYDTMDNPVVATDALHALRLLAPQPGERILDAGCGTGRHLAPILATGANAVGLDFSSGMLALARLRAAGRIAQADLQHPLPFRRGTFDAVLCALIGEHLEHLDRVTREFHAALRPTGRLMFTVYHPDLAAAGAEANFELDGVEHRLGAIRYSTADYVRILESAGFHHLRVDEFPGENEFADRKMILAIRASASPHTV